MAEGRDLHQPDKQRGQLVPYRAAGEPLARPLLPYERELIRLLGCSEEEYRHYTSEVALKSRARPAGYELIPDIRCDPVSIIVSLVIGVALSAVGALLAPKPQPQSPNQQEKRGKNIRLASRQGSERFGATFGFDSINDLANYAEPIPIVFARREQNIGGILASTQLVWSRAFSYGNEQGLKLLMIVGEQGLGDGIAPPSLAGIFLGTTPLDAIYENKYCFYWKPNTTEFGRIKAANRLYGTRAQPWAGDPQVLDDIFLAPTPTLESDPKAFCQSYTPTSNAQFGCYSPIANGTGYRVNLELVPLPLESGQSEESLKASINKRIKISGGWGAKSLDELRHLGQRGLGREYCRHMGITRVNGQAFASGGPKQHKARVSVKVGDTCTFVINGEVLAKDTYWPTGSTTNDVNVDDINNATIQMREQADDMLQIGQTVMIGRTVWVVKNRSVLIWGADVVGPFDKRGTQEITLECIEVFATGQPGNRIGVVSDLAVQRSIRTDDQGFEEYEYDFPVLAGLTVGPGYYPLMKVAFGVVRNTRPCDVTEIGIKSQVWNRANGICNFASLPNAAAMRTADFNSDSITSGVLNAYYPRTSVFTVFLRPAGTDENGVEYPWKPLGEQFAVRGATPTDQYNFIRIMHPEKREYEFRLIPKNGADITQNSEDNEEFWLLDARANNYTAENVTLTADYNTAYGVFRVQTAGRRVLKGSIEFAPELATDVKTNTIPGVNVTVPQTVIIGGYIPNVVPAAAQVTGVELVSYTTEPSGTRYDRSSFYWELWGQASFQGKTASKTVRFELPNNRWIRLTFDGRVEGNFPLDHPYFPGWRAWVLEKITVDGSGGAFNLSDQLICLVNTSPSNDRNPTGYTKTGVTVKVTAVSSKTQQTGQESGYAWEILGSAQDYPIGTVRSKEIPLAEGGRSVIIKYTATCVEATDAFKAKWDQTQAWDHEKAEVVPGSTTGDWKTGVVLEHTLKVTARNPFLGYAVGGIFDARPDVTIGVYYVVSSTTVVLDKSFAQAERVFEENGQIVDITHYRETQASCDTAPEHSITYITETVKNDVIPEYLSMTMCGLAVRAGRDFSRVDQLRVWLETGISVRRFHPSELDTVGPSNMFPDLVYYLLTDRTAGLGRGFNAQLINTESFTSACQFLRANKLFFNGALGEAVNAREYITGIAPFFLLDFVIGNGQFSLSPAIPVTSSGEISTGAVPISALFTSGNIVENTFKIEYLEADQRRDFIASIRWRGDRPNMLSRERTLNLRYNEPQSEAYRLESYDLTDYCGSLHHATLVARYLLSVRRRITHTISFKTVPDGLSLAPGSYIKVITQASPFQVTNNGVVAADGSLVTATPLDDNEYPVWYYNRGQDAVVAGVMRVVNGIVENPEIRDTLVTLNYASEAGNVYQVQEITLEENGLVQIVASEHPVATDGGSLIAYDLVTPTNFVVDF